MVSQNLEFFVYQGDVIRKTGHHLINGFLSRLPAIPVVKIFVTYPEEANLPIGKA